jgi:hypothetical protein
MQNGYRSATEGRLMRPLLVGVRQDERLEGDGQFGASCWRLAPWTGCPCTIAIPMWPRFISMHFTDETPILGSAGRASKQCYKAVPNPFKARRKPAVSPERLSLGARLRTITHKSMILLVPGAGIEPARPCGLGILSPMRLPVPPPRLRLQQLYEQSADRRRRARALRSTDAPGRGCTHRYARMGGAR